MPGIAGIIGSGPAQEKRSALRSMLQCMMHERFYRSGDLADDRLALAAGWVSQKGTFADCSPIWNEKRDICLIFSGETFPDPSEIERLKTKGHDFESGNASYIVHLYEQNGIAFLERLNGWFSGLLIDAREQKALLFNDRYGVNRIYYHEAGESIYFASEAKSLLKALPELRRVDLRSLGEFISCSGVLQNRTLFHGINSMPGGSVWTFSPGARVRKETYFRSEAWESQRPLKASEFYEKLNETWGRVLPRYFAGNQPVGLSLTGGVDSRMILAWAPRAPGTLPCYTFGGRYRECADVTISREIARICRQPHQTIPVDHEFLSDFPALAEKTVYISDGAMDVTGTIDLYVQRKAREIASVRMSGVYGGEILRRLVMFKPASLAPDLFDPELARAVQDTAITYANELQGHRLSFTAFKQAPWYMTAKFSIERSQLTFRTPYFDNDLVALAYQTPADIVSSNEPSLRLISDGNPALKKIGTDRGLALASIPGVTEALHQWQEFTFKAEYAYDYGMPQWLARLDHAFSLFNFERLFLGRHKFHHFRVYYRDELSKYVKEILLDSRTRNRPYLRGERLEKMVKDHTEGRGNYTMEIHKVLATELTQRLLLEQK